MTFKLRSGNKTSFKNMGSSPVKHSGKEMYSAKANPTIDRGHGKEDRAGYETIIENRKKSEAKHDAFHAKHGPDHDLPRKKDRKESIAKQTKGVKLLKKVAKKVAKKDTSKDIETDYEKALRGLALRGSDSDVLRKRKERGYWDAKSKQAWLQKQKKSLAK